MIVPFGSLKSGFGTSKGIQPQKVNSIHSWENPDLDNGVFFQCYCPQSWVKWLLQRA